LSLGVVLVVASTVEVIAVTRELRAQALRDAVVMAEAALARNVATHAYLEEQLKPAVFPLLDGAAEPGYFDARWMSSTHTIREIEARFQELMRAAGVPTRECREFAIGARTPANEASLDERAFLARAAADPSLVTWSDVREIDGRRYLVVMRRGETMDAGCLRCHGEPADAPAGLLRAYGSTRSFGRRDGELVSGVTVRVPLEEAYAEASLFAGSLSMTLLAVLAAALGIQFALQSRILVQPIRALAAAARAVARAPGTAPAAPVACSRELRALTSVFNAMARRVARRDEQLERAVRHRTAALAAANAQLVMRDRLASLGTLATGMAHELNNPLAYVKTNLSFLAERLEAAPGAAELEELRAAVRDAQHGARRAGVLVSDLMRFAHPTAEARPVEVDVYAELSAALKLTGHRVKQAGRLELHVPVTLPRVRARELELSQVLVNLITNATDALPEGRGTLNLIRVAAAAADGAVTIVVEDNGCGIPAELLPRVFDPFVTTKPIGRGTGLGLSVCHGIVTSMGGRIEVESTPGEG
ncbi:MAG TPA: DUF3365 domain-containing protein, partial [Anaeromyxobacteraceae bacterium]|nr:DUF3365 domain-containing protein [Anaeromyxobacteraceae bacterium]